VDWFIPAWFVLASGQLSHRLAFWQSTFSTLPPQTCVGVRVCTRHKTQTHTRPTTEGRSDPFVIAKRRRQQRRRTHTTNIKWSSLTLRLIENKLTQAQTNKESFPSELGDCDSMRN
jgi:hypothetical protein